MENRGDHKFGIKAELFNQRSKKEKFYMNKIYINQSQLRLLTNLFNKPFIINRLYQENLKNTHIKQYYLILNEKEKQYIIDYLSDIFIQKGLQENDEPNKFGLQIEELIDIFYN